jgi:hypothetical protein
MPANAVVYVLSLKAISEFCIAKVHFILTVALNVGLNASSCGCLLLYLLMWIKECLLSALWQLRYIGYLLLSPLLADRALEYGVCLHKERQCGIMTMVHRELRRSLRSHASGDKLFEFLAST